MQLNIRHISHHLLTEIKNQYRTGWRDSGNSAFDNEACESKAEDGSGKRWMGEGSAKEQNGIMGEGYVMWLQESKCARQRKRERVEKREAKREREVLMLK